MSASVALIWPSPVASPQMTSCVASAAPAMAMSQSRPGTTRLARSEEPKWRRGLPGARDVMMNDAPTQPQSEQWDAQATTRQAREKEHPGDGELRGGRKSGTVPGFP